MKWVLPLALLSSLTFAGQAAAKTCELMISSNDQMMFDQKEMTVAADCDQVKITLEHVGKLPVNAMGHNWVLTKTADFDAVTRAGLSAGLDKGYLPPNDPRVLAHTDLIGGGQTTSVTFDLSKLEAGGDYTFFCSFPGHWALMKGKFIVQ